MKEIKLTQGQVTKVDDEDFEFLSQWKWYASWRRSTKSFCAQRTQYVGGGRINQKNKMVFIHREIMKTPDNMVVDHINHDTLDNRKENLRNVTQSQNLMNQNVSSRNILGVTGISKHQGGFRARIKAMGKNIFFPVRKNIEESISDRKNAEKEYFGEFAKK